jgi:hypothetical protein
MKLTKISWQGHTGAHGDLRKRAFWAEKLVTSDRVQRNSNQTERHVCEGTHCIEVNNNIEKQAIVLKLVNILYHSGTRLLIT